MRVKLWAVVVLLLIVLGVGAPQLVPVKAVVANTVTGSVPRLIKPPVEPASAWGKELNPEGLVYTDGFRVFYFDRTTAAKRAFEDRSETIAIKYAWDELHGISSEAFAAYWVGLVEAEKAGPQKIDFSLSWSRARVFVNGKLVQEAGRNGSFTADFRRGPNLIEVEYINNWHTTEFKLTLGEMRPRVPLAEVGAALRRLDRGFSGVHYIGLYESDNRDTSVVVKLSPGARKAVLWLDSHEAIDWRIDPGDDIAAIVIASYSPGSRAVNAGDIPIVEVEKGFRLYHAAPTGCSCAGARYYCENSDTVVNLAARMQQASGLRLTDYAVNYNAAAVVSAPFDAPVKARIDAAAEANERKRAECDARQNPDFDSVFAPKR